jgi:hypothetical protein
MKRKTKISIAVLWLGLATLLLTLSLHAQLNVTVSDGKGNVWAGPVPQIAAATQPATSPSTQPVAVITPPATQPTTSPSTQLVVPAAGIMAEDPGFAGKTNVDVAGMVTAFGLTRDSNKYIVETAAQYAAASFVSANPATPGHLSTDYPTLSAAKAAIVAGGKRDIINIRFGETYTSAWDSTLNDLGGSSANPIILAAVGAAGPIDYSLHQPAKIITNGIGFNGKSATNYLAILGGIQIRPVTPGQGVGFNLVAPAGFQDGMILLSDPDIQGFQTGINLQASDPYPISNVLIYRGVVAHNYSGKPGGIYCYAVYPKTIYKTIFDQNGYDPTASPHDDPVGMAHDFYDGAITSRTFTDEPGSRFLGCWFLRASADGLEGNIGGWISQCLFGGDPLGGYGGRYRAQLWDCVVDGFANSNDASGRAYLTLAPPAAGQNNERGIGIGEDCSPTAVLDTLTIINKGIPGVSGQHNTGGAWVASVTDQGKSAQGFPQLANPQLGNTIVKDLVVYQWPIWSSDGLSDALATATLSIASPLPVLTYQGINYLYAVSGIANVIGTTPNYVDPTRCVLKWAQFHGFAGLETANGTTGFLGALDANHQYNYNPIFDPDVIENWIQQGFVVMGRPNDPRAALELLPN